MGGDLKIRTKPKMAQISLNKYQLGRSLISRRKRFWYILGTKFLGFFDWILTFYFEWFKFEAIKNRKHFFISLSWYQELHMKFFHQFFILFKMNDIIFSSSSHQGYARTRQCILSVQSTRCNEASNLLRSGSITDCWPEWFQGFWHQTPETASRRRFRKFWRCFGIQAAKRH